MIEHHNNITGIELQALNFIPVVTLFINENIKFLKNIKLGFKITISWNKYTFEITTHRVATLLENPGNLRSSWKLLEKRFFFFNFPWKSPGKSQGHQVLWFQWVLWSLCCFMRKKTVLPRIMPRMDSLITFKHFHSLVNLISVWNRFSDKIKHCLKWFLR